jgi:hypothetical protein
MDGVLASLPPVNRLHKRFWFFFAFHSSSLSLSLLPQRRQHTRKRRERRDQEQEGKMSNKNASNVISSYYSMFLKTRGETYSAS